MASTNSTGSTAFTGNSSYSADLQNAISRAVSFASLPIQLLQNKQNDAVNRRTALQSLTSKFQSLQSAISYLNNSVGVNSYQAVVSTDTVAKASTSAGVTAGSYSLNVSSIGSQTNTMSKDNLVVVSYPAVGNITSSTSLTLTVDGHSFTIANPGGNLNDLASAINASAADVQATVVNVGSSLSPDYRLSIQGRKYAATSIDLSDGNQSLLNTLSTGSNVQYQVNGQPSIVNSDSRSLTLSPGLTVSILQTGTTNINVTQSTDSIASALSTFASTYNAVVDELAKSRGQNAGALSGDSIIYTLQDSLRNLVNSGVQSGTVASISDLGLTFDQSGHLSFDNIALNQTASSSLANVLGFLGTQSGSGFLKQASDILTGIDDSVTGVLPQASESLTKQISSLADNISSQQDRVTLLQQTLTAQMSKADALISSLEQKASYFTTLFTTIRQNNSNNG